MTDSLETPRILRMAAWVWLGYLIALLMVDSLLYPRLPRSVITTYYPYNGLAALLFLGMAYWEGLRKRLGEAFLPLMILLLSAAPILLHHVFVPRFPPGPLSNAEGVTLRQMPILFLALALIAWRYDLFHVMLFSLGTAAFEIALLIFRNALPNLLMVFFFIALVRTVSFIVIGLFINRLMSRLRAQSESLRQANAQLTHYASALETLTVSRERNRMARELHDTLAHTLTGLSVTLETVKAYWEVDAEKARALLESSLQTTRSGLEETRRALKSLRASPLEDLGLGLALRQLAESAAQRASLDLELALPDPMPNLTPDVEQCLYRVAQEAVENVIHHANAKRLTLRLEAAQGRWRLTVQDDGLGFDPRDKVSTGHFGLVGMKERAALAGGQLTIESQKGKGSKVVLEI